MKKSNTTSVVIVDTETYALAKVALDTTLRQIEADEVLIFSDRPEEWAPYGIIPIPKIRAIDDYNRTILQLMPEQLKTDFALVIQYDGFALNRGSFTELFYGVDYIGAPWPADMFPDMASPVGNGGFSLRSRKLVEIAAKRCGDFDFSIAEDLTICVEHRQALEAAGVAFAPVDLARRFSVELDMAATAPPFGFHGLHLLPRVYASNVGFMLEHLPQRCFKEGSHQLDHLRFGFTHLGDEAKALLAAKVAA